MVQKGRVLVVDDDAAVCQLIDDILAEAGFWTVRVQTDVAGYAALSTLPTFRATILDINLGEGTTGFDIARFARQVSPSIKVVYVSGDASQESFRTFGLPDSRFLEKPFSPADLLEALNLEP